MYSEMPYYYRLFFRNKRFINRYYSLFVVFSTSRRLDRLIHFSQGQIDKRIHGGVHNHMIIQGRKKLEDRRKTRNLVQNRQCPCRIHPNFGKSGI